MSILYVVYKLRCWLLLVYRLLFGFPLPVPLFNIIIRFIHREHSHSRWNVNPICLRAEIYVYPFWWMLFKIVDFWLDCTTLLTVSLDSWTSKHRHSRKNFVLILSKSWYKGTSGLEGGRHVVCTTSGKVVLHTSLSRWIVGSWNIIYKYIWFRWNFVPIIYELRCGYSVFKPPLWMSYFQLKRAVYLIVTSDSWISKT